MIKIVYLLLLSFVSNVINGQIIANHKIIEEYGNIPQQYIDEVKKMWVSYAGESHSGGIRGGLNALAAIDSRFAVNITESGTPESYTTTHLRVSRATWGDYDHSSGWIYGYGEEDWFNWPPQSASRTKAGIDYCNTVGPQLNAFGFGWCWDTHIDSPTEFGLYITTTQDYINHCSAKGYPTKVFFTTGTVDIYYGEEGYNKHLGYEQIRNYVRQSQDRVLFDYADILCYDDGSEVPNTTTWNGNTYPIISSKNLSPEAYWSHISEAGAIRLAKAMWWMLARIAGWDGGTTHLIETRSDSIQFEIVRLHDELLIRILNSPKITSASLLSIDGTQIDIQQINGDCCIINTSALTIGPYVLVLAGKRSIITKKIFIQ